jgi:ATP phosphoribosyltransferase
MTDGTSPLVFAIPSKGRILEAAQGFLDRSGLKPVQGRGARDYRGTIPGLDRVEVAFLSASDIARELVAGNVHLGLTGLDLMHEATPEPEDRLVSLTPLGFSRADVVVAVPQAWIDVRTMDDLDEVAADLRARHGPKMRVATKYVNLTRRFFAERGVADYRIVESLGATEGAPASGAAELIVDITTTGATLAANALKVLDDGVILRSEANLVASLGAPWGERARAAARTVLARIAAEEEARTTREVRAALDPDQSIKAETLAERFGATLPLGADSREIVLRCRADAVFDAVDALLATGARDVTVRALAYVFQTTNPLAKRLFKRLGSE